MYLHCDCLLLDDGPGSVGSHANELFYYGKCSFQDVSLRGQYALGLYLIMSHKTSTALKELNFYGHLMRIV